jgi:sugar lactone lactonase YvrE
MKRAVGTLIEQQAAAGKLTDRRYLSYLCGVAMILTASLAFAAPASAAPVYTLGGYVGSFGQESPNGVAVDPSSADVYVVDGANRRVQEFGPEVTPNFLAAWGWEVNQGGSNAFEICTVAAECQPGASGSGAGEFGYNEEGRGGGTRGRAHGVAVDPVSHDVYVADGANNRVEYFQAGGKYLHQFNGAEIDGVPAAKPAPAPLSVPVGVAVDAAGQVYVEDTGHDLIDRFSAGGEYECQITGTTPGSATECDPSGSASTTSTVAEGLSLGVTSTAHPGAGLAVDPAGNVYVANIGNGVIDEFSSSGAFVRALGEGVLSTPEAVTVDSAGDVFALSGTGSVYEFDAAGATVTEFTLYSENPSGRTPAEVDGLAVSPDGNRLYASNYDTAEASLLVYGRFAKPMTEPAATPVLGAATLQGTVNPEGLPVEGCEFQWGEGQPGGNREHPEPVSFEHSVPCAQTPSAIGAGEAPVSVTAELGGLTPYTLYHYRLVARNATGTTHGADLAVSASADVFGFQLGGADALEMSVSDPTAGTPSIEEAGWQVANPQAPDSQAGSHPFDVTTRFLVNDESDGNEPLGMRPKDYYVNLPAGFAPGGVAKIPRCRISEMQVEFYEEGEPWCATASQVGVVRYFQPVNGTGHLKEYQLVPVYNMVPAPGAPAELAFPVLGHPIAVTVRPRSDGDFGISAAVRNVSEQLEIDGAVMTLWGVPASPVHDPERFRRNGFAINNGLPGTAQRQPLPAGTPEVPFLSNPTRCGAVAEASVTGDSWLHPGRLAEDGRPVPGGESWVTAHTQMYPDGITGCGKLTFEPQIEVRPSTSVADSPMGMTVTVRVPQNENPNNLATPELRNATVTLPQGVSIDPSAANGLGGCTPAEIKLHSEAAPECPDASQIGRLELVAPSLPEPLSGRVYLSSEHSGNVFHIFQVIEGQGLLIKLEGTVVANEQTGQLTTRFTELPQLPFSELKLTFDGGAGASLASPQHCGTYTTTTALEPYSQEGAERELGHALATPSPFSQSQFASGCGGAFAPSFSAGTSNPAAGAFSPFSLTFSRSDGEQDLSGVSVTMPPGLSGKLAGVQQCSTAEIEAAQHNSGAAEQASPSCPAASQLGTVQAGAGPGEKPFYDAGKVYLTGPYKGAPFGLVEVVPLLAGPFDLGTVVVRQTININPNTAQVTVASDPLPTIIDGVPLRVRTVHVEINRPEFTFNPTSCDPMNVTGALSSTEGATANVSSHFQVQAASCATLKFAPKLSASTSARASKAGGASLDVKVASGTGQANIAKVDLQFPKQLSSRLTTLQKACTEAQFNANPAGCPAAADIGSAIVHTPILNAPLAGPVYLVSHGGAAFPDVEIILQGEGVELVLDGKTQIKQGITYSHFETVPDEPFTSFETKLPTGRYSIFGANLPEKAKYNFCGQSLSMPTTIVGQNGVVVHPTTKIGVTGCPKTKKAVEKKKKKQAKSSRRDK